MQSTKVAQVMLSARNEKLNAAAKQLADIKLETICEKLRKQEGTVKDAVKCKRKCCSCVLPAKRRKLH